MVKVLAGVTERYQSQMNKLRRFVVEKETPTQSDETILFLSIAYKNERATVLVETGDSFDCAWDALYQKGKNYIQTKSLDLSLLKVDMVKDIIKEDQQEFAEKLTKTRKYYFRYGVSFGDNFRNAFLEQELNGYSIIRIDSKSKRGFIDERNLQSYIRKHRPLDKTIDFSKINSIYTFTTKGYIIEDQTCYELHTGERDNGRRMTPLDKQELESLVRGGSDYLARLTKDSGIFTYGYFACFNREINHYNTLRHASSLYSMCETYEYFPSEELRLAIIRALRFLINNFIVQTEEEAFLTEKTKEGKEIKLGGNAASILAITKYTEVFEDDRYLDVACKLADGIKRMQNEDGSFVHVLHYPSLELKDKYRIIYYDGEAAFALMRLYKLTKEEQYLQMVKIAFDHFIANDYWKHHDHWLSYCTNELTIYSPEERYFEFGLKNVEGRLDYIYQRITTFPTFLELTLAAYRMVKRMKEIGVDHLLENFDEEKLVKTIHQRAEYQRNGYFYPELAMYYKKPDRTGGAFFIRHHSFRTRIDDVEHNLSGYIAYYNMFQRDLLTNFSK
ncbi:hypothetical protein SH601_05805 [Gracilibacillus sp. S3-1-1]|uniref:Uncharacterized protein n=1 Tax=Gracilibacillus pellucidus TaxID=3095368 RepID=A0ACC6M3V4_9BACI|nr:hypothetical protein [Gracilibacillus sp. S3-1-1]MDX8045497.1 hypothetical protein [Gracilibacillus sp. S3-1-1]